MTFFIDFVFIIFIFTRTVECQNDKAVSFIQPNITSSSLTGAFRPTEIEMQYKTQNEINDNSQQFAKYMVSIRRVESSERFGHKHFCGGAIIRPNLILTAAHCVIRNGEIFKPSSVRVVARTPFRLRKTSETEVIRVKEIIIHKQFLHTTSSIDIALLKLRKAITLDQHYAAVIKLPTQKINNSNNCVVLGWGKLYLNGPMANEILQINVSLHSKILCQLSFQKFSGPNICASDIFDMEKNPCSGDSGGPLICNGVLTGIVSYGAQCGLGYPTVYTDVYAQRNWITKNISATVKFSNFVLYSIIIVFIFLTKRINCLLKAG